jgi:predicted HicB family RNase H-like nuclease
MDNIPLTRPLKHININVRLTPRLSEAAKKKAAEQEKSLSEYVRDLIKQDIKKPN